MGFVYVELMSEKRRSKRLYKSDVEGMKDRSRPWFMWLDAVKNACKARLPELRDVIAKC